MPFITVGDINLYYEIHGEGFPLLFVSGLAGSTWSWGGQVPFFKDHYKCIVFDNRGAGMSEKPPGPYSISRMAVDALGLMDRLLIEKTLIFSLSMGGMIALELARIASHRLEGLLLGCTHAGGKTRISPPPEAISLLMNNEGLSREEILRQQTPLFFSQRFRTDHPDVIEEYNRMQLMVPLQPEYAFQAQLRAISQFDCTDALAEISNPALIVTGTEDILIPPANSTYLSRHLPNAELIEIPGAGHALHVECREFLNRAAHDFYQRHVHV